MPPTTPRPMSPPRGNSGIAAFRAAKAKADERPMQSFYSADARERLFQDHVQLFLHRVTRVESQFGPQWNLLVSEGSADADKAQLSLKANGWRDELFTHIEDALAHEVKVIGPLAFTKVATQSGQEAWTLEEWEPF